MHERRVVLFSGRVQGVGFRMTALQAAEDLPLAGTVRNLDGGDVELDVEGDSAHIDLLVQRLGEQFGSFVRSISQRTSALTGRHGPGLRITH